MAENLFFVVLMNSSRQILKPKKAITEKTVAIIINSPHNLPENMEKSKISNNSIK